MSIDVDDLAAKVSVGIYGDDRMTEKGRSDAFAALSALLAEVERLREEAHELRLMVEEAARAENANAEDAKKERAAVVAYLREVSERRFPRNEREQGIVFRLSHEIERGEHRREEE